MKHLSLVLVTLLFLGVAFVLADGHQVEGTLMDAACGERAAGNAERAANHSKSCALMPACEASGYGLIKDGTFHKFDDAGNKKAKAYLEATEKEKNLKVLVTGKVQDDGSIQVEKIEDAE